MHVKKSRGIHMILLRSIYFYTCFAVSLLLTIPQLLTANRKAKTMDPKEFNSYVHNIASRFARGNVARSGTRFHIKGLENIPKDKAVLFVSNHQGDFDIAVFLAYIPIPHGYVSKIEIMKVPLLRDWMKLLRCVFIDRSNIRQTAGAFVEGIKTLKSGHSLVMFPEGTRSKSSNMGEFKPAAFKLATKPKVPIVPVTLNGTYNIMEANNNWIKPADVYVTIHQVVETDDMQDTHALCEHVYEIIKNGLGDGLK